MGFVGWMGMRMGMVVCLGLCWCFFFLPCLNTRKPVDISNSTSVFFLHVPSILSKSKYTQVVVLKIFYFHPYPGKWSNLTSIFFRWVEPPTRCRFSFPGTLGRKHPSNSNSSARSIQRFFMVFPVFTRRVQCFIYTTWISSPKTFFFKHFSRVIPTWTSLKKGQSPVTFFPSQKLGIERGLDGLDFSWKVLIMVVFGYSAHKRR